MYFVSAWYHRLCVHAKFSIVWCTSYVHDARNYCRPVLYIQSTQPYLYITVQIQIQKIHLYVYFPALCLAAVACALWWSQPIQISQNSPPTIAIRNECVTRMHSMGVLMSGRGPWDYYDPRVCVVWLLRQCRLRFDVTHIPPIQSAIEA